MIKEFYNYQQNLWKLLEITLNSYLPTPSNRRQLRFLQNKCSEIIKKQIGDYCSYNKNRWTTISYFYKKYYDLCDGILIKKGKTTIVKFYNSINYYEYDPVTADFLKKFEEYIRKNISPYVIGAFLHGSLATNDYTGFSDVDAGLFVKDAVMFDPGLLKRLQKAIKGALRLILKYDNLQHHGLFIIPEGFLSHYPEEYLPIDVFKYARSMAGSFQIAVNAKRNIEYAQDKFMKIVDTFSSREYYIPHNLYDLKHNLSVYMILPTVYLQAEKRYIYKKKSFKITKKNFPKEWSVMDRISEIRNQWLRPRSGLFQLLIKFMPNCWYTSLFYRKTDWHLPESLQRNSITKLANDLRELSLVMTARLVNETKE